MILDRILQARRRQQQRATDREVEQFLLRNGGRFTDDIERRIGERMVSGRWD